MEEDFYLCLVTTASYAPGAVCLGQSLNHVGSKVTLVAAATNIQAAEALREAHGGQLPRPRLQLTVRACGRLRWAVLELGVPIGEEAIVAAAAEGALESLRWLHEQCTRTQGLKPSTVGAAHFYS